MIGVDSIVVIAGTKRYREKLSSGTTSLYRVTLALAKDYNEQGNDGDDTGSSTTD